MISNIKRMLGIGTPDPSRGNTIVVNAEKVVVTGRKSSQKLYRRHSGRPGGMKVETFEQLQARIPERIVEKAVKGMLPKNALIIDKRVLKNALKEVFWTHHFLALVAC